jgi:hypothetical protein
MILDQFCIFFDSVAAAATALSTPVNVSPYAGRDQPVNVTVTLSGSNGGTAKLAVTLQESDDKAAWADVATFNLDKPDDLAAVLVFALPYATSKKFVRLSYALTGTPDGLTIFAGVTRDHFAPYAAGQYIDRGKVVA